jgi:hypothetical protein
VSGYDPDSVLRSIRRYLSGLLPQPWSVTTERVEVRDDARPAGVIEMGEVRTRRARVSVPQGEVEEFAPVTVTLYPPVTGTGGTPLDPRLASAGARVLSGRVRDLIVIGAEGVSMAGPERMPLWDYSAIAPGTAGPAQPIDVLWAEDYSVRAVQDPLEARRWSVIAELRVSWERPGRERAEAPVLTGLPGAPAGTPIPPEVAAGRGLVVPPRP